MSSESQKELAQTVGEMVDNLVAVKGRPYTAIVTGLYSMASLSNMNPLFGAVASQIADGIGELLKDESLTQGICDDVNMLMKANMDAVKKARKE